MSDENMVKKNKKSKGLIIFLVSIGIIAVVIACFIAGITKTPEYALYKTVSAIKNRDYEKTISYINIDSIAQNRMNAIKEELMNSPEMKDNPFAYIAIGMFDAMSSQIIGEIKKGIKAEIENPDNNFKDISPEKAAVCLAVKKCGDVVLTKDYTDKNAKIGIKNTKKDEETIYLIMERNGNSWQIIDITGYAFDGKK